MSTHYTPRKEITTIDELNVKELKQIYFQWKKKKKLHLKYPNLYDEKTMKQPTMFLISYNKNTYIVKLTPKLINSVLKKFKKITKDNIDLAL